MAKSLFKIFFYHFGFHGKWNYKRNMQKLFVKAIFFVIYKTHKTFAAYFHLVPNKVSICLCIIHCLHDHLLKYGTLFLSLHKEFTFLLHIKNNKNQILI